MLSITMDHDLTLSEYFYRAYEWILGNDWIEGVECPCKKGYVTWEYSARKGGLVCVTSLICPTCKKQISMTIR